MNRRHCQLTVWFLSLLCLSAGFAQYRCDWSVVGIGGGEMSSSAYKCGATAGQTAAGFITGSDFRALVGFWLPEGQVGIQEADEWSGGQVLKTRLYAPQPNPTRQQATIRYALDATRQAMLQ